MAYLTTHFRFKLWLDPEHIYVFCILMCIYCYFNKLLYFYLHFQLLCELYGSLKISGKLDMAFINLRIMISQ